ncbi:Lrp/AsnC family transcriptional regulator [Pseudomonas oryzihabitans]|jgi:DNA-binding Lrp family transcriptional regulator|uniref:AsnC family transcriptional regulator n=1 Tax=Pseudomonas oryzihabitans TaxID=47885 RepID=A0A0U4VZQ7_9PSED|nr:Lrp/AsnC family transcriptional regulator [Pseudomonas oryzihabitans]ALZ84600.1 AsnC family transcriptional regulator [Pseudomonas oryzihabitans]HAC67256.1 Lrp/AsnC family transcriptional regulator [Pseudomonas sp.]
MKNESTRDSYSLKILAALQQDGRLSVQDLSQRIGLSTTPTWKRLKALEKDGVIQGYTTVVDRTRVGLATCVLAEVNLSRHVENVVEEFERAVQDCPAIIECFSTTGQADYLLKVVTADIASYDAFLHSVIFKLPGVSEIRSAVVLREIKRPSPLPLDQLG